MRKIYLGNDWDIRRDEITVRGDTIADNIPVRGLLSLDPDGDAIDPTLELDGVTASGGFLVTAQGFVLTEQLLAAWEANEPTGEPFIIYERVVIDDEDYSDATPLQVERDRPPTEPEDDE